MQLPFDPEWFDEVDHGSTDDRPDLEHLLRAVDQLPKLERAIIEAVFFEQESKRGLARRLGISRPELEKRLKRALRLLMPSVGHQCRKRTQWGQCQQRVKGQHKLCAYHRHPDQHREDAYYHRKVVLGQVSLVEEYLDETEINATMNGRRHEDGRRLDAYVID